MTTRKPTKADERAAQKMLAELEELRDGVEAAHRIRRAMPEGWDRVERDAPCSAPRTKITIALDADMVHWFRGLGRGYQTRINKVLRAYMYAVASGQIETEAARRWRKGLGAR